MAETKLGNSPLCRNIVVLSVLSVGLTMGYVLTSFNPLVPVFKELYNDTYHSRYGEYIPLSVQDALIALTSSLHLAGGFVGALTVTNVLQFFSPRQAMIFWTSINVIGGIIIAAIGGSTASYEAIIIGRFVMGYSIGVGLNVGPVIVAEYSIPKSRPTYQSLMGLGLAVGPMIAVTLSHPKVLGTINLWIAAAAIACTTPLLYLCLSPWIPESPRTLLRQGKRKEATEVLKNLRVGDEGAFLDEISSIEKDLGVSVEGASDQDTSEGAGKTVRTLEILRNNQYRRQFLLVVMLYTGAMAVGINHVYLFSDNIFIDAGIPRENVTYATIGVFALQAVAATIGIFVLASLSSRKVMLVTLGITTVSHAITAASIATQHLSSVAGYFAIIGVLLLLASSAAGPNLAVWALGGDLTIEQTRATILRYAGAALWFTAWLTGFTAPYLQAAMGPYSFLVWMVFSAIFLILVFFFIPDTKGKTSDEIQSLILGRKLEANRELANDEEGML